MDWNAFIRRGKCGGVFGEGGGKEASTSYNTKEIRGIRINANKCGDERVVQSNTPGPDFVTSGTFSANLSSSCTARFGS